MLTKMGRAHGMAERWLRTKETRTGHAKENRFSVERDREREELGSCAVELVFRVCRLNQRWQSEFGASN